MKYTMTNYTTGTDKRLAFAERRERVGCGNCYGHVDLPIWCKYLL